MSILNVRQPAVGNVQDQNAEPREVAAARALRRKGRIIGLVMWFLFFLQALFMGKQAYPVYMGVCFLYSFIGILWLAKTHQKRVAGHHLLKAYGKRKVQETISSVFDGKIGIPTDHPLFEEASRVVRLSRDDANAAAIVDDLLSRISSTISELDSLRVVAQRNSHAPVGEKLGGILEETESMMKQLTDSLRKLHVGLSQRTTDDHQLLFSQTSDLLAALAAEKEVDQLAGGVDCLDVARDSLVTKPSGIEDRAGVVKPGRVAAGGHAHVHEFQALLDSNPSP